ncbi:protein phosphatase 1 regulatory subunit 16A-like isoform X2 [Saccostrea echinata]|uniref:protein phosphatase 1 regulatory subunit 16A-like isoform X2 n=1 Tax=Saccostrea echinata TaxID=191078 RepID=UPI002A7EF190|nr:protein phosphatase 1 regulatory subunit 16A-like isoform X2 [Saccostrea echinata]
MADHSDLVAEIPSVERMGTQERLKHAKKRRSAQLKKWANYEKQLDKDSNKKSKKGQPHKKHRRAKTTRVRFKGNIMLLESAARNDLEDVKRLLSAGVNPDVTNEDGLTALHQCCIDDNEEMLKLLLEFGASVNARDTELWTPLHAAATCGHVHLCRYLIDKGAELLAVNADGNMPYDICEDEVTLDYIETEMAKRGITQEDIDETRLIPEKQMLNDLKQIAKRGGDLEFINSEGATPLHIAAANGYQEVAEFLLDHHVSVDRRDFDSWQPIHAAACWLQPEILEILVRNGADIDAKTRIGETAFDLCEDAEIRQKILDMKDEIETNKASRTKDSVRRSARHTSRSLSNSSGSVTNSNTSLNEHYEHPHHHHKTSNSASIRRSSMRGEKSPLFMKEAREEALHFGWGQSDEDLMEEDKENSPATNIEDVQIIIDEEKPEPTKKASPPPSKQPKTVDTTAPPRLSPGNTQADRPPGERQSSSSRSSRPESAPQGQPSQRSRPQNPSLNSRQERPTSTPNSRQERPTSSPNSRQERPTSHRETTPDKPRTNNIPKSVSEQERQRQQERRSDSSSPRVKSNSYQLNNTETGTSSNVRYPSGPPSITLADLKRQRAESRSRENSLTDISSQVQNMFINSLSSNNSKKYSSSSLPGKEPHKDKNGHNTNNNTQGYHPEAVHKFKAPHSAPVIGEEDKQGCCVVM